MKQPCNNTISKENKSPQYHRTDQAIVDAFCRLLMTRTYESITINDILTETPISRAAFYQHFVDKEAIGEQMLATYTRLQEEIISQLGTLPQSAYNALVQQVYVKHHDFMTALRKIHTDKVNLLDTTALDLQNKYLEASDSPYRDIEASVYAKALTEFQFICCENPIANFGDPIIYNHVMIEVFLRIMKWEKNDTIRQYMYDACPKR